MFFIVGSSILGMHCLSIRVSHNSVCTLSVVLCDSTVEHIFPWGDDGLYGADACLVKSLIINLLLIDTDTLILVTMIVDKYRVCVIIVIFPTK